MQWRQGPGRRRLPFSTKRPSTVYIHVGETLPGALKKNPPVCAASPNVLRPLCSTRANCRRERKSVSRSSFYSALHLSVPEGSSYRRVEQWVKLRLPPKFQDLIHDPSKLRIGVREVACGDPSCAPIDTIISFIIDTQLRGEIGLPFEVCHCAAQP